MIIITVKYIKVEMKLWPEELPCQQHLQSQIVLQDVSPAFLLTTIKCSQKSELQLQVYGDQAVKSNAKHQLELHVVKTLATKPHLWGYYYLNFSEISAWINYLHSCRILKEISNQRLHFKNVSWYPCITHLWESIKSMPLGINMWAEWLSLSSPKAQLSFQV